MSDSVKNRKNVVHLLREFSIPLITGIVTALIWANLAPHSYHIFTEWSFISGDPHWSIHHVINHIFMAFFFGIAAVEITTAAYPGGDLNPPRKAIVPLMATIGGVVVPAGLFIFLAYWSGNMDYISGWGVPTATDIALAWLVARLVFGGNHPAITFLLLLAIADDAIGLAIIAIAYPNPLIPLQPAWLLLTLFGAVAAFLLRRYQIKNFWPYLLVGGVCSWLGMNNAGIDPALALVAIVPFMPGPDHEQAHIFDEPAVDYSTIANFEHTFKIIVDFGLFGFGLVNAGVSLVGITDLSWFILIALIVGKSVGVTFFVFLAKVLKFPLPEKMGLKESFVAGCIASVGLTVSLFMSTVAFTDKALQDSAKMGALMSVSGAVIAIIFAKILRIKRIEEK